MKKNLILKLLLGIKKGLNTPTLPQNIIELQSQPLIRILRVVGGLSFLLIVGKSYLKFPISVLYVALFFCILFTIYHFYISILRIRHIFKLLKSDELDI